MSKIQKYQKDSIKHLEESNLIQLSRDLLLKMVESSAILEGKKMTEQSLKEARLILGYLNASHNILRTRMHFFKMTGLESKIERIKATSKVAEE